MDEIKRLASGAPWESMVGYSRAVKAGDWLLVSGTTSFDEQGVVVGRGQMYAQARQAISNIQAVLERAGMSVENVVRTRIFVTDIEGFGAVARAHQEVFGANPPAATLVEVSRLLHPEMMIEIEADAFAGTAGGDTRMQSRSASPKRGPVRKKAVTKPSRARR